MLPGKDEDMNVVILLKKILNDSFLTDLCLSS